LTQKQGFLILKQEIISEIFAQNFCEFEKPGYFQKISELQKLNYSETRENKKFGNFCLTQGLKLYPDFENLKRSDTIQYLY